MAKFVGTLYLVIDTQCDDRRAAQHLMEDVRDRARRWLGIVQAYYTIEPYDPDEGGHES